MKASVKWIKELLPELKAAPPAIAKKLTQAGIEVEGSSSQAGALAGVIVGEVKRLAKHPDADALRIAEVFDGEAARTVVCGAPNVAEGQKVAFAPLGTSLPNGMHIERRKIRGVESEGMICSESELGMSDEASGILVLKPRARPGRPIAEVLGLDDVVFEISATPNRPDVLSHLGLARELAAIHHLPLPRVSVRLREAKEPASARAKVEIRDAERCAKYVARIITGVRIGPSSPEVVRRLKSVGQRSISNVVDATNLALLELGHPLHAFDLDKLKGSKVVVRTAAFGEKLTTIDQGVRTLSSDDLVIADSEAPVALAGVMGGLESGVTDQTVNVLLESALFDPKSIRRTARRHALHTEASHRFERGADPAMLEVAIDRAAELILDLAGGEVHRGRIVVEKGVRDVPVVPIRHARASMVIGRPIEKKEVRDTLGRLGLRPVSSKEAQSRRALGKGKSKTSTSTNTTARSKAPPMNDALFFEVPSWRVDLGREEDLIEEIARLAGYDSIPTLMPSGAGAVWRTSPAPDPERRMRELLAIEGFFESVSLAFNSRQQLEALAIDTSRAVEVANPLGEESALMRMSLVPALLRAARLNQDNLPSVTDLHLFEIGKTFVWSTPPGKLPVETLRVALLVRGHRIPPRWCAKDEKTSVPMLDAYDLKAVVETVLAHFRVSEAAFVREDTSWLHPRSATRIEHGGQTLGFFGELHPDGMAHFGLEGPPVFIADLALEAIERAAQGHAVFRPLPKHPPATRDLSFFIARDVPAGEVLSAIERSAGANLEAVDVFDVYDGTGLPEGTRSLAVTMTFRAQDRTLTDSEVEAAQGAIIEVLTGAFGAELRMA